MRIQTDNDFDQLFKDKLGDIELVPSDRVWKNISGDIKLPSNKKKEIPFMWLAAASISLLFVLSLLFIPKKEPIKLQASVQTTPENIKPVNPAKIKRKSERKFKGLLFLNRLASIRQENDKQVKSYKISGEVIANNLAHKPQLAVVEVEPTAPVIRDDTAQIASVPSFIAANDPIVKQEIIQPHVNELPEPETGYQHVPTGIRSVGDLVNFVVRKVDHRSEKLIEFSNHDEGSSISGINLGLFKIRSKQNELKPN